MAGLGQPGQHRSTRHDFPSIPPPHQHDIDVISVSVDQLAELCDPLSCWIESGSISADEVWASLHAGEAALVETPSWIEVEAGSAKISEDEAKRRHIKKVAFFVQSPSEQPITIDVGCPALGYRPEHIIYDGNHRLAGAIMAGRSHILATIAGDEEEALEMLRRIEGQAMSDIDSDGYPTDEALAAVRNWDRHDISGCFDYIGQIWRYPERWNRDGRTITASTGGWSGNEDLIGALRENQIIWLMTWYQIQRGGHYIFKLPRDSV